VHLVLAVEQCSLLNCNFLDFFVVPVVGKTDINFQSHEFVTPKKEIMSPADIASKWERSEVNFTASTLINM